MAAKKAAKSTKTAKTTKQGQRAPGKTQTSISLSVTFLTWAQEKAAQDGRSLSNWIEQQIRTMREAEEAGGKGRKA